jgi:hypothetical protein
VGGTVAAVAGAQPAAAADNDPLTLGRQNAAERRTRSDYTGAGAGVGVGYLFQSGATFSGASASSPAALGGYTTVASQPTGVFGYPTVDSQSAAGVVGSVTGRTATGVIGNATGTSSTGVSGRANGGAGLRGEGAYGLVASGGLAAVEFVPNSAALPTASTDMHQGGELYVSAASESGLAIELWFCTVGGTPGIWTQIAGPTLQDQFHAINPIRVYDSRRTTPDSGTLSGGGNRIVDIFLGRDLLTGASTGTIVPEGAEAISFNLAIVDTVGAGVLSVAPTYATEFSAATINWSATGQVLNNGSITQIGSDRKVKVFAGGGSTNFVIDITGYWVWPPDSLTA